MRQLSGFIIKNFICQQLLNYPVFIQLTIKQGLLTSSRDASMAIRSTACILLAKIVESYPVEVWKDVLPELIDRVDHQVAHLAHDVTCIVDSDVMRGYHVV